jgi:hypothetical protein
VCLSYVWALRALFPGRKLFPSLCTLSLLLFPERQPFLLLSSVNPLHIIVSPSLISSHHKYQDGNQHQQYKQNHVSTTLRSKYPTFSLRSRSGPRSPSPLRTPAVVTSHWAWHWFSQWIPIRGRQARGQTHATTKTRRPIMRMLFYMIFSLRLCYLVFELLFKGRSHAGHGIRESHGSDLEWSRRNSIDRGRHKVPLAGFKGLKTCPALFREGKGVDLGELRMVVGTGTGKNWGWPKAVQESVRFCDRREQVLESMSSGSGGVFSKYPSRYCLLILITPHAYLPTDVPNRGALINLSLVSQFEDLLNNKSTLWQPSPMIFALSTGIGSPGALLDK